MSVKGIHLQIEMNPIELNITSDIGHWQPVNLPFATAGRCLLELDSNHSFTIGL